jgi:predicted transcriptional regulator
MIDTETTKEIRRMREKGVSISRISRELNISRPTILRYLKDDNESPKDHHHPESRESQHPFIQKKVIPVLNPSQRVVNQREDVEVTELEVRKEKAVQELGKVKGLQVSSRLQEARDQVEITKLSVEQYEAKKKLKGFVEEEEIKKRAEREARIREEMKQEALAEKRRKLAEREEWIQEYQNKALTSWLPRGISITSTLRFLIKDEVKKVLANRSESEDRWEIERLVKETVNIIIQPFLDAEKSKKKVQLIQLYALPKIEDYLSAKGLSGYVDEKGKGEIIEYVRNHFMKTLIGTEAVIWPNEIFNLLDAFLKPVKEKVREAQEKEQRERYEKKEAEERVFWEGLRNKRKKEEIEGRVENLLQVGMDRFNWYLTIHHKELEPLKNEERERGIRHLEKELKEEIEGIETNQEIEKLIDGILDSFFFEEG